MLVPFKPVKAPFRGFVFFSFPCSRNDHFGAETNKNCLSFYAIPSY